MVTSADTAQPIDGTYASQLCDLVCCKWVAVRALVLEPEPIAFLQSVELRSQQAGERGSYL